MTDLAAPPRGRPATTMAAPPGAALHGMGTRPALIGRRDECEALDALLADVGSGCSRVAVLRGEAGAGKSALIGHLRGLASGWQVPVSYTHLTLPTN